jgi:hypothetical protein
MKLNEPISTGLSILILFTVISCTSESREWEDLLDKQLSKWEIYQSYRFAEAYDGQQPKDEDGNLIEPVGYNKNEGNVFTVIEENNDPVLHISGEIYGCIFTKQEFGNYHLTMKVKWGDKKWEPRVDKLKDSGLLYHSVGECGIDYWRSWMLSQEFQIMEGHMGDHWGIANAAIDLRAFIPEGVMNTVASDKQPFLPIGPGTGRDAFCLRSADYESPSGEWTTIELICFNDKSIRIVNGHVVMVLRNSRYVSEGESTPLTRGKIQIQSEAAEVFFKDIRIKSISALPEEYSKYFN